MWRNIATAKLVIFITRQFELFLFDLQETLLQENNWRKGNEMRLNQSWERPKAMLGLSNGQHHHSLPSCLLPPNWYFWCLYNSNRLLRCYTLLVRLGYCLYRLNCNEDAADDILCSLWLCLKCGSSLALILGSNCARLCALQKGDICWIRQLI